MHASSLAHMSRLIEAHCARAHSLEVVDVGSRDVNGSYRPLFERPGWRYRGLDMAAGPNVDIVTPDPYTLPLPSRSADLVISGQAFEHIDFFWLTFLDMARILRPAGRIFLVAPSRGPEHRHPVDCWRFYPDGFRALARFARLELLEVSTDWTPHEAADSAAWGDTVGVFERRPEGRMASLGRELAVRGLRLWVRAR